MTRLLLLAVCALLAVAAVSSQVQAHSHVVSNSSKLAQQLTAGMQRAQSSNSTRMPADVPSAYERVRGAAYNVSYDSRALLVAGERVLLQSGSVHMSRMPPELWAPLFALARQHGLNMLQTYVFWNFHEPVQGQLDFGQIDPSRNLTHFIELAGEAGLLVNLRIGPYICGEWNFGGFPAWLKFIPDIVFRTDNAAWMKLMTGFVQAVLTEVEPMLARNGGPIVLAQIENEYGSQEAHYGAGGVEYVAELAQLTRDAKIEIPWIMCVQLDAPQDIINTCNGFYCDQWIPAHVTRNPTQPHFWTENWNGWFQKWGEAVPHRPVEDDMYGVARWIMGGGSFHNYYMLHGGTNYARWVGGPGIITSYDYDVAINEYGLPTKAKFNQSRTLHNWLSHYAPALLAANQIPPVVRLGEQQEARDYPRAPTGGVAFLANQAKTAVTVMWPPASGAQFTLPPWSVSIFDVDSASIVFNTATGPFIGDAEAAEAAEAAAKAEALIATDGVESAEEILIHRAAPRFPIAAKGDAEFLCAPDVFGIYDWLTVISSYLPLEQIATTKDTTDYLWYMTNVTLSPSVLSSGKAELTLSNVGDYAMVQLFQFEGISSVASYAYLEDSVPAGASATVTFENVTAANGWIAAPAQIFFLSQTLGLQNFGPFLETITKGIVGNASTVSFDGEDVIGHGWNHQIGLKGEAYNYSSLPSTDAVWQPTAKCTAELANAPLVWYRLQLTLALSADPEGVFALDMSPMHKGAVWVNGHHLGRFWDRIAVDAAANCAPCDYAGAYSADLCRTGCGEASQRYYHAPRAWLRDGVNEVTILEERPGSRPQDVTLVRRNNA